MDNRTAICKYLQQHHTGEEKAVCSQDLQRLFSLGGRTLRRQINRLRQEGIPICSGPAGYYYAANQREINRTVCRLNRLVTSVSNARTGLLFASLLPAEDMTLEITITLHKGDDTHGREI